MKDTEKAKELLGCENCQYRTIDCDSNGRCIYMNTIIDMATWKEQQLIEKMENFVKGLYLPAYPYMDRENLELIEDIKQAMSGEWGMI